MRSDMTKVITERPRAGGRTQKRRDGARMGLERDPESSPLRVSTAPGRKWNRKSLTDLLGPLWRFLEKNAGRPWDKVYSEIREHVHPRKQVELHILDHVRWFVEKDVVMVGKVPHQRAAMFRGSTELYAPFYVHPVNGLLTKNHRRWKSVQRRSRPEFLKVDESHQIRILDGLWFEVALAPIPRERIRFDYCEVRDALTGTGGHLEEFRRRYGGDLYAARKRQLNRREIRRWRPEAVRAGLID